jgi:hypothetical protein
MENLNSDIIHRKIQNIKLTLDNLGPSTYEMSPSLAEITDYGNRPANQTHG